MTIRILHTADLHLDSPLRSLAMKDETLADTVRRASRDALETIVQTCIDEDVQALLIAGDLYDGKQRSVKTVTYLIEQMERLKKAGVKVFYIKGNHDAENPLYGAVDLPDNVHVFDGRGGKVRLNQEEVYIHGVSFSQPKAPDSLLPRFKAPEPNAINIVMLHTSLNGAEGHDPYAPCTVADLKALGFDYWALGHVHKRQVHSEAPWIVMPGIPQGRDIGEAGAKSVTLLTIEVGAITVQAVPTSAVEFRDVICVLDDVTSDDEARSILRDILQREADKGGKAILRLRFTGRTSHAWHIRRDNDTWLQSASGQAEAFGNLWVEKLVIDVDEPDQADNESAHAVAEIQELMTSIIAEEDFLSAAHDEFRSLPPEQQRAMAADEEAQKALIHQLAKQGALDIVAKMRGQS